MNVFIYLQLAYLKLWQGVLTKIILLCTILETVKVASHL